MSGNEWMVFHELYGSYYQAVARILTRAVRGDLDKKTVAQLVQENAFGESWSSLTDALLSGQWPFLDDLMETELIYEPAMPLTTLQKRWLKSMLRDPRIRLFLDEEPKGLEGVEPLFDEDTVVYFDRFSDGDPYTDPGYIRNFRIVVEALRRSKWLELSHRNRYGTLIHRKIKPLFLEYSSRDDKFRLHGTPVEETPWAGTVQVNLSRLEDCRQLIPEGKMEPQPLQRQEAELILTDRRELLERFLLLFCWLEKKTVPLEPENGVMRYRVTLYYEAVDTPEIQIRLLSLGNDVQVLSPVSLREELARRVQRQLELLNK